eukprot:3696100-Prorocentrum_lima.AAC.1
MEGATRQLLRRTAKLEADMETMTRSVSLSGPKQVNGEDDGKQKQEQQKKRQKLAKRCESTGKDGDMVA